MFDEGMLPVSWMGIFSLCPYMAERARDPSGASFLSALISPMRALSSWPNHLSKTIPLNTLRIKLLAFNI